MQAGKCLDCGATFDSKCTKCRNTFWDEFTPEQVNCRHLNVQITHQPKDNTCIYSGCQYAPLPVEAK